MKTSIIATVVTLLAAPVFAQSSKEHDPGAGIFQEHCIACHGPDGRGKTETGVKVGAADLTSGPVQQQSDSLLSKIVQDGKAKMPAFEGKLTDDQIRAVIAHIRQLANKK